MKKSIQPTASSSKTMITGLNNYGTTNTSTPPSPSTTLNQRQQEEIKPREKRPKVLLMGPRR